MTVITSDGTKTKLKQLIGLLVLMIILLFSGCNSEKAEAYNTAMELYEAGSYDDALVAFEELDGYKNSKEMIDKIKDTEYTVSCANLEAGDYYLAYYSFSNLGDYKDSKEKCKEAMKAMSDLDTVYSDSVELVNAGKIEEAIDSLNRASVFNNEMVEIAEYCNKLSPYIGSFVIVNGNAPLKSKDSDAANSIYTELRNVEYGNSSVIPQICLHKSEYEYLLLLYQSGSGNFGYSNRYVQGDYDFTKNDSEEFILTLTTKEGETKKSVYKRTDPYKSVDISSKKVMIVPQKKVETSSNPDSGNSGNDSNNEPKYYPGSEWEKYDVDGSGTISEKEFQEGMTDALKEYGY